MQSPLCNLLEFEHRMCGEDESTDPIPLTGDKVDHKLGSLLVGISPFGRGFSRHWGLPIRRDFGKSAKGDFRTRDDRLDELTSTSMVTSSQGPLLFHDVAKSF
jgi:hypothetical protein